jgi:uncharacterized short protein YbdD (DUF466 family)
MNATTLRTIWMQCVTAARRIAGVPDYDAYVAHLRAHHPERAPPTRSAFFAERERARYRGANRCC